MASNRFCAGVCVPSKRQKKGTILTNANEKCNRRALTAVVINRSLPFSFRFDSFRSGVEWFFLCLCRRRCLCVCSMWMWSHQKEHNKNSKNQAQNRRLGILHTWNDHKTSRIKFIDFQLKSKSVHLFWFGDISSAAGVVAATWRYEKNAMQTNREEEQLSEKEKERASQTWQSVAVANHRKNVPSTNETKLNMKWQKIWKSTVETRRAKKQLKRINEKYQTKTYLRFTCIAFVLFVSSFCSLAHRRRWFLHLLNAPQFFVFNFLCVRYFLRSVCRRVFFRLPRCVVYHWQRQHYNSPWFMHLSQSGHFHLFIFPWPFSQ